jgi:arylsulfatase A-like enzyme/tetratricopeptide (TPR) repeat protein
MRRTLAFGLLVLGLGAWGVLVSCRPGARDHRPNIVLITLDTTRADRIGAYGDAEARTPTLDGLAERGVLFERAYSPVPLTLPSHTTILTGLAPPVHGVRDNARFVVPEGLETVAERLSEGGYATAAFVAAFVLHRSFGLDQGFEVYDDETDPDHDPLAFFVPSRRGEEVTDRALAWLGARSGRRGAPFFLWVHYYDAHAPTDPPPPFDAMDDRYAGEIAYVDAQVGRLIAGVEGAAGGRETLLLVVADHGESLEEHGEATHGLVAYDSTLHVPLIAVGPGFAPSTRSRAFVTTEDVAPTILAALGEPPPSKGRGVALQKTALGGEPGADSGRVASFACLGPAYAFGWAPLSGVRTARWKLTATPEPVELYDVVADPGETTNLADAEPEVVARLTARHAELDPGGVPVPEAPLDPEVEERLATLGYLNAPQRFEPGQAPDPRRGVVFLGLVDRAKALAQMGRVADSIEALEILSHDPSVRAAALRSLGRVQSLAGRTEDAVATYEQLLALTGSLEARLGLCSALVISDRADDALALLDAMPESGTRPPPRVAVVRARALLALRRPAEAEAAVSAVLEREPGNDAVLALASRARAAQRGAAAVISELESLLSDTSVDLGRLAATRGVLARLLRQQGRDAEAVRVLEADPDPPPEHLALLAQIARDNGNPQRAAELYEAALARVPADGDVRRNLADLYDELGRTDEALPLYDELIALDPGDATLRADRGAARFRARRFAEAEADFRAALALDDRLPEAAFNLALLEMQEGREEAAEQHLRRAIELRPDYAKAHFHLARLYRQRGDPRAAEHADRAVQTSRPGADPLELPPVGEGASATRGATGSAPSAK